MAHIGASGPVRFWLGLSLSADRPRGHNMANQQKEHWLELAERASAEQDPKKLLVLVQELNRLLDEREARVRAKAGTQS